MTNEPVIKNPKIMSGAIIFSGTRVPIQNLFDYLEGGENLCKFLDDFPSVPKEAALAVLVMARKFLLDNFNQQKN